jgi:hypothetical protein
MLGDGKANSGTQGSFFRYQYGVLTLLQQISNGITNIAGIDYETRNTTYKAINNDLGFAIGDIISRLDIINAVTGIIASTLWFNETQGITINGPAITDIEPFSAPASVTLPTVTRTPTFSRVTGAGIVTIAAGARSVSILNSGNSDALVNGTVIKRGEELCLDAGAQSDTLAAITYDPQLSDLVIAILV